MLSEGETRSDETQLIERILSCVHTPAHAWKREKHFVVRCFGDSVPFCCSATTLAGVETDVTVISLLTGFL